MPVVAILLTVFFAGTAHADPAEESQFVSATNGARASAHLAGLRVMPDLVDVARRQAAAMASAGRIYHNPNLATDVKNWQVAAENVGRGYDVAQIHGDFMNSPGHRANILNTRVTEIGIGTAHKDGYLYVAEVFRQPKTAAAAPAPAPAPRPPAPKPAPVVVHRAPAPVAPRPAPTPAPAPAPVVAPAPVAAPAPVPVRITLQAFDMAADAYDTQPSATPPAAVVLPVRPIAHTTGLQAGQLERGAAAGIAAALVMGLLVLLGRTVDVPTVVRRPALRSLRTA